MHDYYDENDREAAMDAEFAALRAARDADLWPEFQAARDNIEFATENFEDAEETIDRLDDMMEMEPLNVLEALEILDVVAGGEDAFDAWDDDLACW